MLKFRIFAVNLLMTVVVSAPLSVYAVEDLQRQENADDLPYPFIKGVASLPNEAQLAPGAGTTPDNNIAAEAGVTESDNKHKADPAKLLGGAKGYLDKLVGDVKATVNSGVAKPPALPAAATTPVIAPNPLHSVDDGDVPPITPADVVIRPQISKESPKDTGTPLSPLPAANLPSVALPDAAPSPSSPASGPFSADNVKEEAPAATPVPAAPYNPFSNNQAVKEVLQILENNKPKPVQQDKKPENSITEVPVAPALLDIPKAAEESPPATEAVKPASAPMPVVEKKEPEPKPQVAPVPKVEKPAPKKVKKNKKRPAYGVDVKPLSNDSERIKLFQKDLSATKGMATDSAVSEIKNEQDVSGLSPETKYIIEMLLSTSIKGKNVVRTRGSVGINRDDYDTILSGMSDPEVDDIGMKMNVKVSNREADRLLSEAYDAMVSGQFETAILLYKKALRIDKKNETGLVGLAGAYQKAGSIDQARKIYARLFELYPDNNDAFVNFLQLVADESPADALVEIKRLEEANPDVSALPAQIGMIQWKLGNTQGAIYGLTKALSIDSANNSYRYNLAVVCDQAGYKERAVALYKNLVESGKKGQQIPADINSVQERLTFLSSNTN